MITVAKVEMNLEKIRALQAQLAAAAAAAENGQEVSIDLPAGKVRPKSEEPVDASPKIKAQAWYDRAVLLRRHVKISLEGSFTENGQTYRGRGQGGNTKSFGEYMHDTVATMVGRFTRFGAVAPDIFNTLAGSVSRLYREHATELLGRIESAIAQLKTFIDNGAKGDFPNVGFTWAQITGKQSIHNMEDTGQTDKEELEELEAERD